MCDHNNYAKMLTNNNLVESEEEDYEMYFTLKRGEELLIELFKERPFLYDNQHPGFKDITARQNAWMDISKIMIENNDDEKYTVPYCQKRLTSLRDQYSREKRKMDNQRSLGRAVRPSQFMYFTQLSFLDKIIKRRRSRCAESSLTQDTAGPSEISESSDMFEQKTEELFGDIVENEYVNSGRKRKKMNEIKELTKIFIQLSDKISSYTGERKASSSDDTFIEYLRAELKEIPEEEKSIRRKMIINALNAPLEQEKPCQNDCKCSVAMKNLLLCIGTHKSLDSNKLPEYS
ncbi:uncharacterized protein [Prorops nasuta]